MKKILLVFVLAISVFACTQSSKSEQTATAPVKVEKIAPTLSFKEIKKQPDDGLPHFDVFLQQGDKIIPIAQINECASIPTKNYQQYDIPQKALAACGGWYAGAGDYFYLTESDTHWIVMHGWQDEQQTDKGYHYSQKISVAKK
jgi:hypothetical protein